MSDLFSWLINPLIFFTGCAFGFLIASLGQHAAKDAAFREGFTLASRLSKRQPNGSAD